MAGAAAVRFRLRGCAAALACVADDDDGAGGQLQLGRELDQLLLPLRAHGERRPLLRVWQALECGAEKGRCDFVRDPLGVAERVRLGVDLRRAGVSGRGAGGAFVDELCVGSTGAGQGSGSAPAARAYLVVCLLVEIERARHLLDVQRSARARRGGAGAGGSVVAGDYDRSRLARVQVDDAGSSAATSATGLRRARADAIRAAAATVSRGNFCGARGAEAREPIKKTKPGPELPA